MISKTMRWEILRGGLALAGLGVIGIPEWALPALAQSETVVPFTNLPTTVNTITGVDRRIIDIRNISKPLTPKNQFFTTQHYRHPEVNPVTFRLKITGLVDR